MSKNKTMWAVTTGKDKNPIFHRFNNGPCQTCGLEMCLPDHPHPVGMVYHVGIGRYLLWPEVEALNGKRRTSLATHEAGIKTRLEERRRKTRERVRRHRRRKRLQKSAV